MEEDDILMNIPNYFCWTKIGTEAGETIESILLRKELERINNNGIFLWGIGNSIEPSLKELIKIYEEPYIIFSKMKSNPKDIDINPKTKIIWKSGITIDGNKYIIPKYSKVTSRLNNFHYALICHSNESLKISNKEKIYVENLTNILTGNKVGASQVTSVVKNEPKLESKNSYDVSFMSKLIYPYFVKLINYEKID